MPHGHGPTDFLYQRDGEIIAFARPDLAVAGSGLSSAAPVVDTAPRRDNPLAAAPHTLAREVGGALLAFRAARHFRFSRSV